MSMPESGHCSLENYDRGKRFLVAPERLCADGIYTFALKAQPKLSWQACLFVVRVNEVQPAGAQSDLHNISVSFEELDRPNTFSESAIYPCDSGGTIKVPDTDIVEEAYLRHRFSGLDDELKSIEDITTTPFRVMTVPHVITA